MIDATHIGATFPPFVYEVERGQIRAFAAALGDPSPLYRDVAAAQAAGYPDLPAPPTFATRFGLWANPTLIARLEELGAPYIRMLHGEQTYTYYAPICAGDVITAVSRIAEIRQREGGSGPLTLLTLETTFTNQRGEPVGAEQMVVVVRG